MYKDTKFLLLLWYFLACMQKQTKRGRRKKKTPTHDYLLGSRFVEQATDFAVGRLGHEAKQGKGNVDELLDAHHVAVFVEGVFPFDARARVLFVGGRVDDAGDEGARSGDRELPGRLEQDRHVPEDMFETNIRQSPTTRTTKKNKQYALPDDCCMEKASGTNKVRLIGAGKK
jgi:hypothetical protein